MSERHKTHNGRDTSGHYRVKQADVEELRTDPDGEAIVRDDVRLGGAVADTGVEGSRRAQRIGDLVSETGRTWSGPSRASSPRQTRPVALAQPVHQRLEHRARRRSEEGGEDRDRYRHQRVGQPDLVRRGETRDVRDRVRDRNTESGDYPREQREARCRNAEHEHAAHEQRERAVDLGIDQIDRSDPCRDGDAGEDDEAR